MIKTDFNSTVKGAGGAWLKDAVRAANKVLKKKKTLRVSVALVGKAKIRSLNKTYRRKNKPTDVLSFAAAEEKFITPETKDYYLGEIVICADVACLQARLDGISAAQEMRALFIHGLLHLLGHKHKSAKEKKKMFFLQDKILKNI